MISYELALKLKEAGFPQEPSKALGILMDMYGKVPTPTECKIPTLSELIEACGLKGFVMWELNGIIYAGKDDTAGRGQNYYDDYPHPLEEGLTPEEAVANLWLAINKK